MRISDCPSLPCHGQQREPMCALTRPAHSRRIDVCTSSVHLQLAQLARASAAQALTGRTCGSMQAGILAGQLSGPLELMDGSYNSLMHNRAIGKDAYDAL